MEDIDKIRGTRIEFNIFRDMVYPDCKHAGERGENSGDCECKLLHGAPLCAFDGAFYCGVANTAKVCPLTRSD